MKYTLQLCLLCCSLTLMGQKTWTLEESVATAIERNLSIQNIDLQINGAEVGLKQARQARYPSLNGQIRGGLNFGRSIDPTTNTFINETFISNNYSLNTGVLVFGGGRINNSIKQALAGYKANLLTKEQVKRDIALNVATLYLNAMLAKENVRVAKNNLDGTQAQVDQMIKLVNNGARAEAEQYTLSAQLANNDQELVTAENNYQIALLNLKQALLLSSDEEYELAPVPENIPITTDPDIVTFEEVYRSAYANQKSIDAAEMNIKVSELGIKVAEAELIPTLSVGGSLGTNYSNQARRFPSFEEISYGEQIDENLSYGFGVTLAIPIYNNYTPRAGIEQAKITRESNILALEQEKQTLTLNVQQAIADAKATKSSLAAAEKAFEAQELAYDNAKKRFEVGNVGIFELTNLKAQYDNAQINYLLAKYNYIFRTKVLDFYLGKPIKIN